MNKIQYQNLIKILNDKQLLIKTKGICNQFDYISYDSNKIKNNALFICKGFTFKKEYLEMAINKGAIAYISQIDYQLDIPCIIVSDIRKAMAIVSQLYYDYPAKKLTMIGLTGTKGKTTTAFMIKAILDDYLQNPSAILSTVETYTGTKTIDSHLTTPESLDLHRYLQETLDNKIKYMTMEVSSQAYKLDRVYDITYDIGLFLNIGEDHIGPLEHESFEEYLQCKLDLMRNCKIAIINKDSDYFQEIYNTAQQSNCQIIVAGEDYFLTNIEKLDLGFKFVVNSKKHQPFTCMMAMEGRFNLTNALCAISVAKELNIPNENIINALNNIQVRGRMNVYKKDKLMVIVDFAHNQLSFSELYKSLKTDYPTNRIITVVGSPGSHALLRRKDIGDLCGKYSDYIYLTADDPQFSNVLDICEEIASHIKKHHHHYEIIEDRTQAIETAIKNAKNDDIIVLAGKGEETYLKVKGECVPYESDVQIVKRLFNI
ncbi:MAG: UDP-N-acetylmuramoyl-L-alanyl-D-glutamate--2,6-diaminopimelate ligase [Erysipelotrichaceae bacterium]